MLIIKRPLHKRKLLQAMTSAALKQTNYYQHPRRGFLKASQAQGSSPRAYAGTPGVGPSRQMNVKLCLSCVSMFGAGREKRSWCLSGSKRSQWPTNSSSWQLQNTAVWGDRELFLSFSSWPQQLFHGTEWMMVASTWVPVLSYGHAITLPCCHDEFSSVHLVLTLLVSPIASA